MGQILQADKIGTVSHSSGIISLTSSVLTVGGQQYTTTGLTRTITTDVTLAANTLYMVYAVINSTVLELRISANVNSVGPAGFNGWKLVGAFVTNFNSLFGTTLAIDTKNPTINAIAQKTTTTTPATNGQFILTTLTSQSLTNFFDLTNGFLRFPITGTWRITITSQLFPAGGTANGLQSNVVIANGYKLTLPSSASDYTDSIHTTNGPYFNSTDSSRIQAGILNAAASGYFWMWYQSNLTGVAAITDTRFDIELQSIPVAIKDM